MRLHRAAWPAFGASCLLAFCAAACGSTGSNAHADGSGGATGSGASPMLSGSGPSLVNGGSANASGGQSGIDKPCAGTLVEAQRLPLDMYVMLDVSGSMLEATAGDTTVTKWQAVSSALNDFVSDPASDGIGIGIQVFPLPDDRAPASCTTNAQCANFSGCFLRACWNAAVGLPPCNSDLDCGLVLGACDGIGVCSANSDFLCPGSNIGLSCGVDADTGADLGTCQAQPAKCIVNDDCRAANYATPAVAIAPLPGARAAIVNVLQKAMPGGLTPTGPALTGAIDQAGQWAGAHTDHQVVAVLATDGLPTLKTQGQYCEGITEMSAPADDAAIVAVATSGAAATPKVSTFVIGVFAPSDVAQGAPDVLDRIAKAGSNSNAFIVNTMGDVEAQFRDALNQIRAQGLSCDLAVPKADAGTTVDYNAVNVDFSGDPNLGYVADAAHCDAVKGGWYYDTPPDNGGTPTRIMTCPATCEAFKATDMGSVKIELGCGMRMVK